MTLKAWLEGDPVDLALLSRLFSDGDIRVIHDADEDAFYLIAPEIKEEPAPSFGKAAPGVLDRVNGLARVHDPTYRPVRLSGRYTGPRGNHSYVTAVNIEMRLSLSATAVAVGSDGEPLPEPPSPRPRWLALADADPEVAEALRIMSRKEPLGWVDLYKVYEIVRHATGAHKIAGLGWLTRSQEAAFVASANRPDISGSEARHARMSGETPVHKISIETGLTYVSGLMAKWLNSLSH